MREFVCENPAVTPVEIPANVRIGTSSFATNDWVGVFYPERTRPQDYLSRYSERFGAVEIDATFYGVPTRKQVAGWRERTPEGFIFAAKIPQSVTHGADPEAASSELEEFIDVMGELGPKRGPLLFQFPYVSKAREPDEYRTGDRFRDRLAVLIEPLPRDLAFAVEVRNEKWLAPPLFEMLRRRGIALAFIDYYTTPNMARIAARPEAATADFAYVRFLGHHREMDARVEEKARVGGKRWDAVVQDRTLEMRSWVPALRVLAGRMQRVFVFFNNHYAGHAPGSIELFRSVWRRELAGDA